MAPKCTSKAAEEGDEERSNCVTEDILPSPIASKVARDIQA